MSNHWNFHSAGQLVFGSGVIHEIGELTAKHGFGKVLIVTDKVLVDVGAVGSVKDSFKGAGVDVRVFDGGEPEPSIRTAESIVEEARSFQPDAVVGVGGGSNMDLAKCVAAIYALVHAIEAYTARDSSEMEESLGYEGRFPITDCLAAEAIQLIGGNLVTVFNEPGNLKARENMALAATLAGMAFSNAGVAIVHALEYPMGGALHCSHGAGNGLLLPYVMRFNLPGREETMARIALLLGHDVGGLSPEEGAIIAIEAVEDLRREIGIPLSIRDLGGREDQLPGFAMKAHALDRLTGVNPRKVTLEDLEQILRDAF
jgi:alcohol dehydrogenase class IV